MSMSIPKTEIKTPADKATRFFTAVHYAFELDVGSGIVSTAKELKILNSRPLTSTIQFLMDRKVTFSKVDGLFGWIDEGVFTTCTVGDFCKRAHPKMTLEQVKTLSVNLNRFAYTDGANAYLSTTTEAGEVLKVNMYHAVPTHPAPRRPIIASAITISELEKKTIDSETDFVYLFLRFLKEVVALDDIPVCRYVLSWIAALCKGVKPSSALYLYSVEQGVGKSTLISILKGLLGDTCISPTIAEATKYTRNTVGYRLICIDEAGRLTQGEKGVIRQMISLSDMNVRERNNIVTTTAPVNCSFIFASNITATTSVIEERRFVYVKMRALPAGSPFTVQIFRRLNKPTPKELASLYHFMLSYAEHVDDEMFSVPVKVPIAQFALKQSIGSKVNFLIDIYEGRFTDGFRVIEEDDITYMFCATNSLITNYNKAVAKDKKAMEDDSKVKEFFLKYGFIEMKSADPFIGIEVNGLAYNSKILLSHLAAGGFVDLSEGGGNGSFYPEVCQGDHDYLLPLSHDKLVTLGLRSDDNDAVRNKNNNNNNNNDDDDDDDANNNENVGQSVARRTSADSASTVPAKKSRTVSPQQGEVKETKKDAAKKSDASKKSNKATESD